MTINTKICGISDPHMVEAVIAARAKMIGFVHFAKSPRHVSIPKMADLIAAVNGRVHTVAVVVDPDDALLEQLVNVGIDVIQLHGSESPARMVQVQKLTQKPVMKALSISVEDDLERITEYDAAEYILLDAKAPKGADLPGGNGEPFDWNMLQDVDLPANTILSGGLTPGNVVQAVRTSGVSFVDVSSGVESAPGVKDAVKIQQFVDALGDL